MSQVEMHIAFEAARLLESTVEMGEWGGDCFVDPDVDNSNNPYIVISLAEENMARAAESLPESITVLNRDVPVIVKSLSIRMC
ncbi:MAG TPA: hypothetical protein VFS88_09635 [Micavibrio sp.]|nr:hypothetical protein [Micavibrio sp.]